MNTALIVTPAVVAVTSPIQPGVTSSLAPTPRSFGAARATQPFSVAWAAGFADGEACIHIARQRYRNCSRSDTFVARVYITQNCLEVLEHFRNGAGIDASIYKIKRTAGQNRQCYSLQYEGARAMALITLLLPHLIRKRDEALTLWTYWVQGQVGTRHGPKGVPPAIFAIRERLYLKMRSLK